MKEEITEKFRIICAVFHIIGRPVTLTSARYLSKDVVQLCSKDDLYDLIVEFHELLTKYKRLTGNPHKNVKYLNKFYKHIWEWSEELDNE